jgi:hypothetical protein
LHDNIESYSVILTRVIAAPTDLPANAPGAVAKRNYGKV